MQLGDKLVPWVQQHYIHILLL